MMKIGSIVVVALLWLGVAGADAATGSEQDASKILSPKAALKKALVAVGTPDETKPELADHKNGAASIPTLELMQLEEFAYEMKDRYEALGANDTDGERSLLRSLQSGEPDCSVTSNGAVKCCQTSQGGGNDLCIHFDCPVQGQLSDACTCRVQVNGYFCDSCSLCGDDGMDFDCNNVQYGMAANVCPNDSDSSYSDVYGNDSDEEYYSDVYGNDSEPDSDSYSSSGGGGGGGDDEPECEAVANGGVQCCSYTDDGIYGCMTFYCSGGELTGDCGCSLSLNGNACRECDICPGGDGAFYADCSNIGGGSLPACSDAGVGSGSNNPGSGGGNGMGNNGGGSGSGNNGGGSGSGTGLGGFFGGGNNEGGNGGTTNGGGSTNGGGTTNGGGGTSGNGGGGTGNGGFSFPWSQQTASSAPSAGLAAASAIVIGGAVMAAF